jgi:hypothetical protein
LSEDGVHELFLGLVALVVLSCLFGGSGIGVGAWHHNERLEATGQQIQRYRHAALNRVNRLMRAL